MANTIKAEGIYGTYYYIDSSSSADKLTYDQMTENVKYIYSLCRDKYPSWTDEAIAAMCGNAQSEGILNPAQWQYGGNKDPLSGYGLFQWTPSTNFTIWANENNLPLKSIDSQIGRVEYERENHLQYYATTAYNFSFTDFLTGNHTVDELAKAWLYNYERPKDPTSSESIRVSRSINWYNYITDGDIEPTPPDPDPPPIDPTQVLHKHLKFYMYPAWRGEKNVNNKPVYSKLSYNIIQRHPMG